MSLEFVNRICQNCKNPNYMVLLGDYSKAYKYKCINCNRYFNDIDFEEPLQPVWKTEFLNKMDREKLIDLLENEAIATNTGYVEVPLFLFSEIIALLKEQEKAKVVFGRCKDGSFATECGHCGMYLDKAYSICPKCNKELDWNSNQD